MPKFKEFDFEALNKEHLSVLRSLGRVVGVKAPAAKSKKELIARRFLIKVPQRACKDYDRIQKTDYLSR